MDHIIWAEKKIRARLMVERHLDVSQPPCYNGFGDKPAGYQNLNPTEKVYRTLLKTDL